MHRPLLCGLAFAALLAGCGPRPEPRTRAQTADIAACRARTEASFNRQNRYLLSERDTSSSPFSTSGNTGITTQGLSQQYGLDSALANCMGASQNAGTGAAFSGSPAERVGTPSQ